MNCKVAIMGSCVTRDLFDYDIDLMSNIDVSLYLSRSTMASVVGSSFENIIVPDDTKTLKFDDKRFIIDLKKSHFELLQNTDWDVLIIDLIDERHSTYRLNNKLLTYTKVNREYVQNCLNTWGGEILNPLSEEMINLTELALDEIKEFLQKISKGRPVLIHRAKYAVNFLENQAVVEFNPKILKNSQKWNFFLDSCYDRLLYNTAFINIEVPFERTFAGGEHKWDMTPFHYDKGYYLELADLLISYISNSSFNNDNRATCKFTLHKLDNSLL